MIIARLIATDSQGRVLLLRRALDDRFGGCWELVGGKIDTDESGQLVESPQQGLARETLEEANLRVVGPMTLVRQRTIVTPRGAQATELTFTATVEGAVALSHEHIDFCFHTPGDPLPAQRTDSLQALALVA